MKIPNRLTGETQYESDDPDMKSTLEGAVRDGVDFRGADLCDAYLSGVDLSGSNLCGVDLTGSNLTGAKLTGVDFTGAYIRDADLNRTTIPNIKEEQFMSFKQCERCGQYSFLKICDCRPYTVIHEEEESVIFASREENAAEKYAQEYNDNSDYLLMDGEINVLVRN